MHPKYLDSKGLVALWREALLAKHVLMGKTSGYISHPQLARFKDQKNPAELLDQYLASVYEEALQRGYNFDKSKIKWRFEPTELPVTSGQIEYERQHLLKKLKLRDAARYTEFLKQKEPIPHPLFRLVKGEVEEWEKIK